MSYVVVDDSHVKFEAVRLAIEQAGFRTSPRDRSAILVWSDSLKYRHFEDLRPWQVINRIPAISVLTRKVSHCFIMQKFQKVFPNYFNFYPNSYTIPFQRQELMKRIEKEPTTFIYKPDAGSLGQGIEIFSKEDGFRPNEDLAVVQEYIPSLLLGDTKFDLRVYALISSVEPLRIYVYRDGLARFCSEKCSSKSMYSKVTNVAFNEGKVKDISEISRLISEVFPILKAKGVDIEKLWRDIDEAIGLTVISAKSYLSKAADFFVPSIGYNRCFHILGFDILIDEKLKPWVLEVNHRPSFEFHRPKERRMKVGMIKEAIEIAVPLSYAQAAMDARKWGWGREQWSTFITNDEEILGRIKEGRKNAETNSRFVKIWPSKDASKAHWGEVLLASQNMPLESIPGFEIKTSAVKGGEA